MSISVSIIEDDAPARHMLADWIRRAEGFGTVNEHGSAESALKKLPQEKPAVVLMDINLPGMNGLQVTRQIIAERRKLGVIMLTAYDDAEQAIHAFRAGASAYCPKEVEPTKLIEVIRQVLRGHYGVGDQLFDREGIETWMDKGVSQINRPYVDDSQELFSPLSPREMQILQYVTRGLSNKEIAFALGISHQTVKNHMTAILHKLDVEDRTQAAVYALRHGWVRLQDSKTEEKS